MNCERSLQDSVETLNLFMVGLNHRTAPLRVRQQLALADDDLRRTLGALAGDGLAEAAILSTCNRLEIYGVGAHTAQGQSAVEALLARRYDFAPEQISRYLYQYDGHSAAAHLMRVAAGLDSMILGEAQILGQVQQAFALAQSAESAGPVLSHLFTLAAHTGKRARTETDISRHITSVSHAAVYMAQAQGLDLHRAQVLVVGSGEMAYLAAQALRRHAARTIRCINRTYARAADLAQAFDGEALDWYRLPEALAEADVVITATGAPHTIIQRRDVEWALAGREDRPLVMIDIAVPRDVDEAVRALPGVQYYDLDDLNTFVDSNMARREAAAAGVDAIIDEELARFMNWYRGRSITPVITALRAKAEALARDEVEAALRRMGDLDTHQQHVVELMAHRIVNRLLHEPTVRLKAGAMSRALGGAANDSAPCYVSIVRDLFALDEGGTGT